MKNVKNPKNRKILQGINSPAELFEYLGSYNGCPYPCRNCVFNKQFTPKNLDWGCPFPSFGVSLGRYMNLTEEDKDIVKKIYLISKILEII